MRGRTWLAIAAAVATLQVAPPGQAGLLTTRVSIYPGSASTGGAAVTLTAYNAAIADLSRRDSQSWIYSFKDDGSIGTTLAFSIQGAPAGYSSPKYDADIPFYLDELPLSLQGVLTKQKSDDGSAGNLADEVSRRIERAEKPEFVGLYQRVTDLYATRLAAGDASVRKVDIRLAYWYVVLSQRMYNKNFVLPTAESLAAADWLARQTTDHPESFGMDSVTVDKANDAIKNLKSWGITKYQRLLTEIDRRLQSAETKVRACKLVKALFYDLRGIDPEVVQWNDPDHLFRLGAATSLAYCLAGQKPSEIDKQTAADVQADLKAFANAGNDAALRNATGRLNDLQAIISNQGVNG